MIQTEGLDAVRTVEPAMKLVKDGDEEKEVPDGMKGRILPFEMVQHYAFKDELREIAEKEARVESITSELQEIQEGFTEDEAQEYINEKEKLDTKKIKKDANAKGDDIEPETKEKLKKLVTLGDEKSKLDKVVKSLRQALVDKTIEKIQGLDDDEVMEYLVIKWIEPVTTKIYEAPDKEIESLNQQVYALAKKYATPYHDLNAQLTEAQDELAGLISQLEGDESSIAGLNALMNSFKD